jgi:transcriptional regulator with XRE-family HTH domain
MENAASDIEHRIAARLKHLRTVRGLSLDALAKRSGVSRSMISLIERAESNATASVLDKLAASLGGTLASFFAEDGHEDAAPVARAADQRSWRDPATGYVRRNLSPSFPSPIELVEVFMPPGTRVAYESGARSSVVNQQIWVITGAIEVTVGDDVHRLATGDCLAMRLDRPTAFLNEGGETAHYLVALTTDAVPAQTRNP